MDAAVKVVPLEREMSIKNNTTPTGRRLGVYQFHNGMWAVKFIDKKPGEVPGQLAGTYTSMFRAEEALTTYLNDFWDISDTKKRRQQG